MIYHSRSSSGRVGISNFKQIHNIKVILCKRVVTQYQLLVSDNEISFNKSETTGKQLHQDFAHGN